MSPILRFGVACVAALLVTVSACDSGSTPSGPSGPGPITTVTIAPASTSVAVGGTQQLVATARDAGGTAVTATFTWTSSSGNATVDASGLVTGVTEGTSTVTATTGGISGTAAVAVTPPPVATVEVDPATGSLTVSQTLQLTATPKDASGAVVAATVAWTSSDATIASVDATGLVTAAGPGQATITATADGQSGSSVIDVVAGAFNPTADMDLSGNPKFSDIMIPAGVTITATGDLDLGAVGDITIAGTLQGECVALGLRGDANVTISGTVSNGCTQGQADQPDLVLESTGDLTLDGGTVESGGNVTIRNDPTLDDSAFPVGAQPAASFAAGARMGSCIARNFSFVPMPTQAASGTDGQNGTDGKDAKTWRLLCRGDATLAGGVRVFGQDGGPGGVGMHTSNTAASATGGNGGKGGLIRLLATGTWTFSGAGNEAIGGDGGSGGFAEATGQFNPDLEPRAAGAFAQSGNGGEAGLIEVRSLSSITVNPGALTITVGDGGFSSNAKATGARGADADERTNLPAQIGGDAVAVGGSGGLTPDKIFTATGATSGANSVTVAGGNGGDGGDAIADAGDGGDGNQTFKNGAHAGDIFDAGTGFDGADGGPGGDSNTKDGAGMLVGMGGDGGAITVLGANGGWGWDGCSVSPVESGGDGGDGGIVAASDGAGGNGMVQGNAGGGTVTGGIGNGGFGGDGEPVQGVGGGKGQDGIVLTGQRTNTGIQFQDGPDGIDCHSGTYNIVVVIKSDPAGHAPFVNLATLLDLEVALTDLTAEGSTVSISGPGNFVNVTGTRTAADGVVSATGIGTVAGFPNVTVTFVGTLTCDGVLTIDYTMGAGGELPQGLPIVYTLSGSRSSGGGGAAMPGCG